MTKALVSCALGVALAAGPALGAAYAGAQTVQSGRAAVIQSPGVAIETRLAGAVIGTAWRHDNSPVPNALLRLRNVTTGRIVMGAQSDSMGRFSFPRVGPGSYIVELVDESGSIRAVGQMFSVGPGDTVATFIRLASRAGWFDDFFSNAAAAALATAASLGVTAVGDGLQPASARF
jgi:hypothetical protein